MVEKFRLVHLMVVFRSSNSAFQPLSVVLRKELLCSVFFPLDEG